MAMNAFGLRSPRDGAVIDTPLTAILEWDVVPGADSYKVLVAREVDFKDIVFEESSVIGASCRLAVCPGLRYWWQVSTPTQTSASWSFTTPLPDIRENAPASERFAPARPESRFAVPFAPYINEPLPEDPSVPLSPWFEKTSYDCGPKPSFDEIRSEIPAPILDGDDNKALIDAYWFAWKLLFDFGLYEPEEPGQAVFHIMGIKDWGSFGSSVDFDVSFSTLYARYLHGAYPYIRVYDNFYARQHENGLINKEGDKSNHEVYSSSPTLPSLLAWGEWDYYMVSGDKARLARVMLPLIKFYEWFQRYQRRASGHYYCEQIAHSSWEIPADVYQALAARALSMMAETVGRADLAEYFRKEYDGIAAMMNRDYWDEKNSFYNARLADGGFETEPEPGRIYKYVRSFDTLMAGLAPRDRAERMIRQLLDPRGFMGQHGVRSLSADSTIWIVDTGRYLNAESETEIPGTYPFKRTVWPPNMVSALRSLDAYGYTEESAEFAERYARALAVICRDYGDITEFSMIDDLKAYGHPRFVGWSGYGPIACLIEYVLGIKLDAPANRVNWRIRKLERHGIERLRFGEACVNLVCDARSSMDDPCRIVVESNRPFTLAIDSGAGWKEYEMGVGSQVIEETKG